MALLAADMGGFLLLRIAAIRYQGDGPCLTKRWVEKLGGVRLARAYSHDERFAIEFAQQFRRDFALRSSPKLGYKEIPSAFSRPGLKRSGVENHYVNATGEHEREKTLRHPGNSPASGQA